MIIIKEISVVDIPKQNSQPKRMEEFSRTEWEKDDKLTIKTMDPDGGQYPSFIIKKKKQKILSTVY